MFLCRGNTRSVVRQEWVGSSLIEAEGRCIRWGIAEEKLGRGITFEM